MKISGPRGGRTLWKTALAPAVTLGTTAVQAGSVPRNPASAPRARTTPGANGVKHRTPSTPLPPPENDSENLGSWRARHRTSRDLGAAHQGSASTRSKPTSHHRAREVLALP